MAQGGLIDMYELFNLLKAQGCITKASRIVLEERYRFELQRVSKRDDEIFNKIQLKLNEEHEENSFNVKENIIEINNTNY